MAGADTRFAAQLNREWLVHSIRTTIAAILSLYVARRVGLWIGHADKSVTDGYSKVKEDRAFRKLCADDTGFGFELFAPVQTPRLEVVPSGTQSELVSTVG
jgi:hypothetical protein